MSSNREALKAALASRRQDVQGLRALAVTAVVAFHSNLFIPGGFIGVDIFFVISGFVITGMLRRELERTGKISLTDFYVRRVRRLTPALIVVLLFVLITTVTLFSPILSQKNVFATMIGALLISSNFVIAARTGGYFDLPAKTNPLLHTWSLSVEEQFYLVYPVLFLILFVVLAKALKGSDESTKRRIAITAIAVLTVACFALPLLPIHGDSLAAQLANGYYSPFPRFWQLGAGALLAWAPNPKGRLATPLAANLTSLAGVGLTAYSFYAIDEHTPYPGWATVPPVLASVLLIYSGSMPGGLITKLLSTRLPVFIGNLSYSWYLWHWPLLVIFFLQAPDLANWAWLVGLLSLVPAWLSYRFVESRYQHKKEDRPIRTFAVAAAAIAAMVAATLGFNAASAAGYNNSLIADLQASVKPTYEGRVNGCHETKSPAERATDKCLFNPQLSGTPIYLFGDSNADQFTNAIIGAAKADNSSVRVATGSGCPVIRGINVESKNGNPKDIQKESWIKACAHFANSTIDWLKTQTPGLVILANTDGYYFTSDTALKADPAYLTGSYDPTTQDGRLKLMRDALARTVRDIQATGNRVLLIQTIPQFDTPPYVYDPSKCSTATILAAKCMMTMPRSFVDSVQGPSRAVVSQVAAITGAGLYDIRDLLCSKTECPTLVDNRYLYRDQTHISVAESKALIPVFTSLLRAVAP